MNSYKITFRFYDRTPESIYLPAENRSKAFSDAHRFITPYSNCCEIIVERVSKAYMKQHNAKYAMENWRVDVDWYSKEYDDRARAISSPFNSLWRAQRYYDEMIDSGDCCLDEHNAPVRVKLVHYVWKDGRHGESFLLQANYEGAEA